MSVESSSKIISKVLKRDEQIFYSSLKYIESLLKYEELPSKIRIDKHNITTQRQIRQQTNALQQEWTY